ncbi:MAG: hypothetical protein LBH07_04840 [Treponema sp.]|jgi:hypothetical protein|nr:hypothetical protein [Treponema sp.]
MNELAVLSEKITLANLMKGIVMQRGERKSIVLFNNGKIGEIPTPP